MVECVLAVAIIVRDYDLEPVDPEIEFPGASPGFTRDERRLVRVSRRRA
jgi:hypothetical protein